MDSDSWHKGYVCDGCDGKIRGVLWHCRECGDEPSRSYDLCQQCYNNGEFAKHEEEIGNHHPNNDDAKVSSLKVYIKWRTRVSILSYLYVLKEEEFGILRYGMYDISLVR